MAINLVRAGPLQPGDASPDVLYDAPTDVETVIVKQILVANTTGTAATITVGIGGVAASQAVLFGVSVAANTTLNFILSLVLEPGEQLFSQQGTAGALTVTMNGVEQRPDQLPDQLP